MSKSKTKKEVKGISESKVAFLSTQLRSGIEFRDENTEQPKVFWDVLSREILKPVSPQFRMEGFNKFFQMPVRKNTSRFIRLRNNEKNEESPLHSKLREKGRSMTKLKQKIVIKPEPERSNNKWFKKKSSVRFDFDTTSKKQLLPFPFADESEPLSVDEAFLIESYFGRRPESKYLVTADINLHEISEKPEITRSHSLYDPMIERLLDDSIQNEDNNERNANTITSIEEKKSRPPSMTFDTEVPLLRNKTYSSRKIRGSGILMDDSSFDRSNGLLLTEGKTSNSHNTKPTSIDKILFGPQDERPLRRKSCTCETCGLNKKLAKNSAILLYSDLRIKNSLHQDDLLSVPKGSKQKYSWYSQHSGSQKELSLIIKLNRNQTRNQTRKKSQKGSNMVNISKSLHKKHLAHLGENIKRSPSSTSQNSSLASPNLKKLGSSIPDSPLFQFRRMESKSKMGQEINSPALKESSLHSGKSSSPLLNHKMKAEDLQFFTQTVPNDLDLEQKNMKMLKLMETLPPQSDRDPEVLPESSYRKVDVFTWKLQKTPYTEIAETSKEYINTPEPKTQTHNLEEAKKPELSRFSTDSARNRIGAFKQESEQDERSHEDTADQAPPVEANSRKKLIERNLAKISAGSHTIAAVDHRPSYNNLTMVNRVKTMHHDKGEPNLQTTDRNEKSINQTVHEVLKKTGQHRGLLSALEKSHQNKLIKRRKISPSPFKLDLSLPYLERPMTQNTAKKPSDKPLTDRVKDREINPTKQRIVTPKGDTKSSGISSYYSKVNTTETPESHMNKTLTSQSSAPKEHYFATSSRAGAKGQVSPCSQQIPHRSKVEKLFNLTQDKIKRLSSCYQQKFP